MRNERAVMNCFYTVVVGQKIFSGRIFVLVFACYGVALKNRFGLLMM